jgi:hypothetical protein
MTAVDIYAIFLDRDNQEAAILAALFKLLFLILDFSELGINDVLLRR